MSPGQVVSTGTFKRNKAIEYGLGCRGGAIRPWFVRGTLLLGGTFEENTSDGRGGVFATNRCDSLQ
jgi:predicted outer membrane repeat protein